MRLLLLTQYFPPEVGAPQNRLYELALRLQANGVEVVVLTAMPNYPQMEIYSGYQGKRRFREDMNGINVYRSSIYVSKKKSIVARLRNYFSFVVSSSLASSAIPGRFDFLLCESPPLFLGYSALYIARRKKAKLIFNVSDLWPESAEKLGVVTNAQLLRLAYRLEERLYKASVLVSGQTQGICRNIRERFPSVNTYWLPNGVDLNYYQPDAISPGDWRTKWGINENAFIALYAGIIGIAQGLEVIIHAAQLLKHQPHIHFVLLGSGPCKNDLQKLAEQLELTNVHFVTTVSKTDMPAVLRSVNLALVPLRKLDLFRGAIPSKIFENLAMNIPVVLGVDGEARELFVNTGACAVYVEPENPEALAKAVLLLYQDQTQYKALAMRAREYVRENFNRDTIAKKFHDKLRELNA